MIDYLLMASSLLAICGVALLAIGYRHSLFSADPATRWFSRSMALLAASIFGRRLTWDLLHPIVSGDVDQRPLNVVFNLIAIAAVYAGLRARLLLIPEEDRADWRWWTAWAHPSIWRFGTDTPRSG